MKMSLVSIVLAILVSACGFPEFRDQMYRDAAAGRLHGVDPTQIGGLGVPSSTIDFYDLGGRHIGYGRIGR